MIEKEVNKKLGLKLKDEIKKQGFTQAEISEKIGISTVTVSFWLNGTRGIDFFNLCKICDILNLKVEIIEKIKKDEVVKKLADEEKKNIINEIKKELKEELKKDLLKEEVETMFKEMFKKIIK